MPKIIGLMKIRNESQILKYTLDHWAQICTGGIYIFDDSSDDNSIEIAKAHSAVKAIIQGTIWDGDREKAEWMNRQAVLLRAQQDAGPDDWFAYFDCDEYLFNFSDFELFNQPQVKAIACRLFDAYLTPDNINEPFYKRKWFGPEFRTIPIFFRNSPYLRYEYPDQRIVTMEPGIQIPIHGAIQHVGKAISVDAWEKKCDYYITFWPKYAVKWQQRKGKAIKEDYKSDFGNKLILWKDINTGFSLENQSYGNR
jgi:glycosyltransferase involved in cell wall biosynthesis